MAFQEFSVNRYFAAWNNSQLIADFYLIERNFLVTTSHDFAGDRRRQIEQRLNSTSSATTSAQFKHLAQQHKNNDDRGSLKVNRDLSAVLHGMRKQSGQEDRDEAVDVGRTHTDCDQ